MAKDLKSGLKDVFGSSPKPKTKPQEKEQSTTQRGLPTEYDRETFIVRVDLMDKIKNIAYWDRQLLKETIEAALTGYITAYEKKNGGIKARPDEVKDREKLRSNSGRKKKDENLMDEYLEAQRKQKESE